MLAELKSASTRRSTGDPHKIVVSFRGEDGRVGNRDRATHLIHWYPAKMFYRIPDQILNVFQSDLTGTLLDPFCGSGTVVIEGLTRGYRTVGIDINPLAQMISRVRTASLDDRLISRHSAEIVQRAKQFRSQPNEDQLPQFWFADAVRPTLHRLERAISAIASQRYREFFLISLSHIVRRCSLADPTIAPPVKMSRQRVRRAGKRYEKNYKASRSLSAMEVIDRFEATVQANKNRLASLFSQNDLGSARILDESAGRTSLPNHSVDLVITSPPYCGAQKYVRSLSLEMRVIGMSKERIANIDRATLGTERVSVTACDLTRLSDLPPDLSLLVTRIASRNPKRAVMLAEYSRGLISFAREMKRVMKSDGHAFVSFGTSRIAGYKVDMAELFRGVAERAGFRSVAVLVDDIPSRGMITKRSRTAGTIPKENVVWLRAPVD